MKVIRLATGINETDQGQIPPLRNRFESMVAGRHAGLLVEPMVDRFPFQSQFMPYHPALDSDYLILKSLKGALFFNAQSYRDENEFIEQIKRKNVLESSQARYQKFMDYHRLVLEKELLRKFLQDQRKAKEIFENRADKAHKLSDEHLDLRLVARSLTSEFSEIRNESYDKTRTLNHKLFWDAVWRNLEKEPLEVQITSLNLQQALRALRYSENQGPFLRALQLISKNTMKAHAEQILEHSSGISLPSELIGSFNMRFHRSTFEKEIRKEIKEEQFQNYMKVLTDYRDQLRVDYLNLKRERIEKYDKSYQEYWEVWDHLNESIPLNLSLSQANLQEVFKLFRYRSDGQVHHAFRQIQGNRLKMMAAQLNEHVNKFVPEIASEMNIFFHRFEHEDEKNIDRKKVLSRDFMNFHQDANLERYLSYKIRRNEKIDKTNEIRKNYEIARDKANETFQFSLGPGSSNLSESLRKAAISVGNPITGVSSDISKLNGNDPVDPITTKSRKTNMSFQTGWKEFINQPAPFIPKPVGLPEMIFDVAKNPVDHFEKNFESHCYYHFTGSVNLSKFNVEKDVTDGFTGFSKEFDYTSRNSLFEPAWSYKLSVQFKGLGEKSSFDLPMSHEKNFDYQPEVSFYPEEKNLNKDAAVLSRNKSDARDLELKSRQSLEPTVNDIKESDFNAELKRALSESEKISVVVRQRDSYSREFRSVREHELSFADEPFRIENHPVREKKFMSYQVDTELENKRNMIMGSYATREASGTKWKSDFVIEPKEKPKKKRSV